MKKTKQVLPRVEQGPRPSLSFTAQRHGKPPRHLVDLSRTERRELVADLGYPQYRADQLSKHYFEHNCIDPEQMSDIPQSQRLDLVQQLLPPLITKVRDQVADQGKTIKTLWKLFDGAVVESVLMKYPDRATLCISSQAGCGMACPFCATGQAGLTRNLTTAEIIEQLRYARQAAAEGIFGEPVRVSNVVFMGMGEPLANYRAVRDALHRMIDPAPEGFGMSARNVTVSTVGLVPVINKLADEGLPVTLAVSLHAPDDGLRDDLIPINSRHKVGELLDSARHYFVRTGRRVSIEYALIKDMNDHQWRAQLLAAELNSRGRGWAHVNPIPLNPTPGSIWTASTAHATDTFVKTLTRAGISTTIRDTRGSDIDGACGQLAAEVVDRDHVSRRAAQAQAAVDARIDAHRHQPQDFDSTLAAISATHNGDDDDE
ncbi:23S rRNA (adenine(2503)-C(2))-methyltransferase RlmN [Arcanobacterium pinnipediorum]|uniref:Probable dual-specificity RNA methyltransferase RlmN n=1 Tax=Arcanobacterium pinnipediorum TaxID=1503041 RepID=A0ABY5AJD3_9ACTO|nr:23S rRNA (adenine(2503)-C(2))-methyltransferase RlmN [Arcanobacterium pinnipediorum]USR79962.1 23S rRNA (adenine(2503)-C(2))-methyltransferase RlmN [Arcanobacterium pinnipediorum]